jgi:hypothetical protein
MIVKSFLGISMIKQSLVTCSRANKTQAVIDDQFQFSEARLETPVFILEHSHDAPSFRRWNAMANVTVVGISNEGTAQTGRGNALDDPLIR